MWLGKFKIGSAWGPSSLMRRSLARTRTDDAGISSELAAEITAIREDRDLQSWFIRLATLPDNLRVSAVGRLVAQMSDAGEDRRAIEAFGAFGDRGSCRAVADVLRERYGVQIPEPAFRASQKS